MKRSHHTAARWAQTLAAATVLTCSAALAQTDERAEQRQYYQQAHQALERGQITRYRELHGKLADYPLLPHLEYRELERRLSTLPQEDVERFLEHHAGSYLAARLERDWLNALARGREWQTYLDFYHEGVGTTSHLCRSLWARLQTGDDSALAEVAPLWTVARSQPDACDPLFAHWMDTEHFTDAVTWERHKLALAAGNASLAGYIRQLMSEPQQRLAHLYRSVGRNPEQLSQLNRFAQQSPQMQDIILHGLTRLARRDAPQALTLWNRYDAQQLFDDQQRIDTQHTIATRLARQGHLERAEALLAQSPALSTQGLTEWLVRNALGKQDWERVNEWLAKLPDEARETERWTYWQARALEALSDGEDEETARQVRQLYGQAAGTRSFYGFLAADRLGSDYHLLDRPIQVSEQTLQRVESLPAVQRARELYILDDLHNLRREWFHTMRQLDEDGVIAAGKLAESWGWYRKSIAAMIRAQSWNDLQLRFPLAYRDEMTQAAKNTAINPHLLFAIARQESAFSHDARSPAGALGLMQLMPATAQQTARRSGIPYNHHWDLLTPEKNIALGSYYLNELLDEFDGNRILAAAAYNAGPTRVRRWLSATDQQLPYDVWIETIPFRETRGYVQNVLAYSVIYSYRMGEEQSFITPAEAASRL